MTRRFALVALWFAATVVAILMATFAVRLVGDNVVAQGPATVTRGEVEADLSTIPGTDPPTSVPAADPDASTEPTTPPPVEVGPASTPSPTVPSTQTTAAPEPVAPPPGPATGDDPAPPTTGAPAPPVTTAPAGTEQSFPLVGGSVRVRCSGSTVTLVSSSPNPGFAMEVRSTGPTRVEVRFEGGGHTSELKAWCTGGEIVAEPKESGSGDGDHG